MFQVKDKVRCQVIGKLSPSSHSTYLVLSMKIMAQINLLNQLNYIQFAQIL